MKAFDKVNLETQNRWVIILLICTLIPALFIACQNGFEEWDTDGDSIIDENEFSGYYQSTNYYETWDSDDDSELSKEEFYGGTFENIDSDDNQKIDKEEWMAADQYLSEYMDQDLAEYADEEGHGAFDEWNNEDEFMDEEEFMEAVGGVGFFDSWDINDDGLLDDNELSTGLFDSWDTNDDGQIDNDEQGFWNQGLYH